MALYDGDGCAWLLGVADSISVAGNRRWPSDKIGGGTATNTSSIMNKAGTTAVPPTPLLAQLLGFTVIATPGAGALVQVALHNGTSILVSLPAETVGTFPLGQNGKGIVLNRMENTNGSNFCIRCSANVTALLHWRRLA